MVDNMKKYYIGVDIGGTTSRVSLGSSENGLLVIEDQKEIYTTKQYTPHALIEKFITDIQELSQNIKVEAIGISCGGPLDSKRGIILSPPNLIGWDHIKIVDILEKHTGIPTRLTNDANASALAEWIYGAGVGSSNMIFLTFGTGMGAGLILNGKLYEGTTGMAGEVGHIRLEHYGPVGYGKMGSFEGFCSGGGIAQLGQSRILEAKQQGLKSSLMNVEAPTAKDIAIHAENQDPLAQEVYQEVSEKLGSGLSILIDILNPDCIVIGSIYQRNETMMKEAVMNQIKKEALQEAYEAVTIKGAKLGDELGNFAAISVAVYYEENEQHASTIL